MEIFGIPVGQLTINGLALIAIGIVIFGLARGLLIPRSTHRELVERADQRAEDYKEIAATERRRGDVQESIATDLVVVGENVNKLLKSLPLKGGN